MTIRIAVCLFGQLRTGIYCAPYIKHSYALPESMHVGGHRPAELQDVHVDFFCFTKDYQTSGQVSGTEYGSVEEERIPKEKIDALREAYQPKAFGLSSRSQLRYVRDARPYKWGALPCRWPMFIFSGLLSSINLKREYEVTYNFAYDMCFCQRFDAVTSPAQLAEKVLRQYGLRHNTVYSTFVSPFTEEDGLLGIGDFWFGGDNWSIDLMAAGLSRYVFDMHKIHADANENSAGLGPNVTLYSLLTENSTSVVDLQAAACPVRPQSDLSLPVLDSFRPHHQFFINNHPGIQASQKADENTQSI